MEIGHLTQQLDGTGLRIGIAQSRFNEDVVAKILSAVVNELERLGVEGSEVLHVAVPGALEIPITLAKLAQSGQFDALIAVGAVIRGETYHFELVSNESGAGISRVALDFDIPVINAVLTTETDEQALVRADVKGREAAAAAVEMALLCGALSELADYGDEEDDEDAGEQ